MNTTSDSPSVLPWGTSKPDIKDIQELILTRISFLEYEPGDHLKEAELATEFGVSRTPVREAISRIQHLGLVETRNGVGNVVVELSAKRIHEVYDIRLHLCDLIGKSEPVEITEEHLQKLRHLRNTSEAYGLGMTMKQYVQMNHALHQLTCDLIGNSVLRSFWAQAFYQAASTWHRVIRNARTEAAEALFYELRDLEVALTGKDICAIGLVQKIHIGYGYTRLQRFLSNRV